MKRSAVWGALVGLVIILLSLSAMTYFKRSQRNATFKATQSAFTMVLDIQALAINDGYFSWTKLQDYINRGQRLEAEAQLEDIKTTYPFVKDVSVKPGIPPSESYYIYGYNGLVYIDFSLKNDFGFEPLPGWMGTVSLNAQKLLDSLPVGERLVVDKINGKDFAYDLKVGFGTPLINLWDIFLACLIAATLTYPVFLWISRRNLYFYETRGLESIIFLFEQAERLTANHSRRVAALSLFVGQKLGFKGRRLRNLYTAALLHDIGKINVPANILTKDGALSSQEQSIMASHPVVSARILGNFKELSHLSQIVMYHHEKMDGSGYPEGLIGSQIPREARIIGVVDAFEALVGDRPYRDPISSTEAFAMLRGMALDQEIVETLAATYPEFATFQTPRWVISYSRFLETM
jgi:putative nucleotidyltransferase with HDIG domain